MKRASGLARASVGGTGGIGGLVARRGRSAMYERRRDGEVAGFFSVGRTGPPM